MLRGDSAAVLKSLCEKTNCETGKNFDGRGAAAWGQIDLAPVRDAGGLGGGDERAAEFFGGGGLSQYAGMHERAGRGRES